MVDIGELHEILQDASIEPPANDEGFHRDKNIQKLQTLYDQTPCMDDLQTAIVGVMADDRKGKIAPAIDRVLDVVSAVTYSTDDLLAIVEFGIRCSQVEDKQIRLRSTQLLALLLQNIPEIPYAHSIWDALVESMLIRVRDKIVSIRVQTIMVLKRLQQPDLPDDEVTAALLRLAVVDTSNVALTQVSVGDLLIRVRDISYEVRCSVFRVFSQVNITSISTERGFVDPVLQAHVKDICTALDRMYLLDQGLHDRNPAVIEACQGMVLQWLHQCHDNVLDFLQYLALDHPVCSTVITFLFDKAGLSDLPQVKSKALLGSRLTPIDSFFWKEQCIHFKNDHDLVEEYCPTLPTYCDLLRHLQEELVVYDSAIFTIVRFTGESLSEWTYERQWVPDAVSLLAVLCEEFEFIQYMTEITSDIYDAMQECEKDGETVTSASILDGLATYFCVNEHQLDAWDLQTQTLVVEGFIKLFLLKRIDDSMKLQAMMELYFHPILRQMVHSNDHGFCSETLQLLSVFYPALANLQFDLLIVTIRSVLCSIVYGTSKIPLDEAALYFLTIFPEKDRAHDALSLLCCVEILAISELKLTKREKETLQKPWWIVLQSLEWTDTNGRLVVLLEEVLNSFKAADATKFKARMEQVIQAPPELTDEDTQWVLLNNRISRFSGHGLSFNCIHLVLHDTNNLVLFRFWPKSPNERTH
ncbi:hypothetical protein DYB32_007997 [Aphanomyces invadans]|uniref:Nuclear condensin complex subunit 3 C-terminal domain-containing protein n=1 Tax=Aphanomyces invadans TaxID=157072 RepID=A0A418AMY0_9STRA|nr:hypothetical protein DYB32_007997 [Aphanomyces invadans]